jgi:hypothetical protein
MSKGKGADDTLDMLNDTNNLEKTPKQDVSILTSEIISPDIHRDKIRAFDDQQDYLDLELGMLSYLYFCVIREKISNT